MLSISIAPLATLRPAEEMRNLTLKVPAQLGPQGGQLVPVYNSEGEQTQSPWSRPTKGSPALWTTGETGSRWEGLFVRLLSWCKVQGLVLVKHSAEVLARRDSSLVQEGFWPLPWNPPSQSFPERAGRDLSVLLQFLSGFRYKLVWGALERLEGRSPVICWNF